MLDFDIFVADALLSYSRKLFTFCTLCPPDADEGRSFCNSRNSRASDVRSVIAEAYIRDTSCAEVYKVRFKLSDFFRKFLNPQIYSLKQTDNFILPKHLSKKLHIPEKLTVNESLTSLCLLTKRDNQVSWNVICSMSKCFHLLNFFQSVTILYQTQSEGVW